MIKSRARELNLQYITNATATTGLIGYSVVIKYEEH